MFNILLQVLDDGHITDAQGRKVDFKQTIIIMTSNAGAQAIMEPKRLGFMSDNDEKKDYERMKGGVMEEDNVEMIEEITGMKVLARVKKGDTALDIDPETIISLYE